MKTHSASEIVSKSEVDQVLVSFPILRRFLSLSSTISKGNGHASRLTVSQIRIVVHLYQRGPMFVSKLARDLGISTSSATEQISALEAIGCLTKSKSELDKRTVLVELTPEASAIGSKIQSQRRQVVKSVLAAMSDSERKAFAKGIELFSQRAGEWLDENNIYRNGYAAKGLKADGHEPYSSKQVVSNHNGAAVKT